MKKRVLEDLSKMFFNDKGFIGATDFDSNIFFIRDLDFMSQIIWPGYRKGVYFGAGCSIVFKNLEKFFTDLCYTSIIGDIEFVPTKEWLEDNYRNPTINSNTKAHSPSGIIESKFKGYSLGEYFQDNTIESVIDLNEYALYLEKFYEFSAKPFFSTVPDLISLDTLTDNADLYTMGLYLTKSPIMKKIILSFLLDKPDKEQRLIDYRQRLKKALSNKKIESILNSLNKIELYFSKDNCNFKS